MAKKSVKKQAAKKPAVTTTGPGLGKKHCPHCNAVIAARSTTCPACQKPIAPKQAKKVKGKRGRPVGSTSAKGSGHLYDHAADFIKKSGGYERAKEALNSIGEMFSGMFGRKSK